MPHRGSTPSSTTSKSSIYTFSSFDGDDDNDSQSLASAPPPPPSAKKHVSFDQVIVRVFNPTLSDNPSVSCGPPIGLDWAHAEKDEITPMDDFETGRRDTRREISLFARMGRLSPEARLQTCQEAGYSDSELEIALSEIREIQERMIQQMYGGGESPFEAVTEKFHRIKEGMNVAGVVASKKLAKLWRKKTKDGKEEVEQRRDLKEGYGDYDKDGSHRDIYVPVGGGRPGMKKLKSAMKVPTPPAPTPPPPPLSVGGQKSQSGLHITTNAFLPTEEDHVLEKAEEIGKIDLDSFKKDQVESFKKNAGEKLEGKKGEFYDSDDSDISCRSTEEEKKRSIKSFARQESAGSDASVRKNSAFDDMEATMQEEDDSVHLGWDVYDKEKSGDFDQKEKRTGKRTKKCIVM